MYGLLGILLLFGIILSLIKIFMPFIIISIIVGVLIAICQSVFKEDDSDEEELKEKEQGP